jgi:hypothetical protein
VSRRLLEFAGASPSDIAGIVRLELHDSPPIAWYWTYLVGVPGVDGVLVVRDHEVPLPRQGLEVRADGLWAELTCETPGVHWSFGLESFGVRLDAPEDARRGGAEIGERLAVGLDIEWEVGDAGPPEGIVHGDVLVARATHAVECAGRFYDATMPDPAPRTGDAIASVIVPIESTFARWNLLRAEGGLRWFPEPSEKAADGAGTAE